MVARILLAIAIWLAPLTAVYTHSIYSPTATTNAVLAAALLPARRGRRYLRKKQVAERYNVDERTVDRMAKDGRLPPYIYLPGSRLPLQDEDELNARDDAAATVARASRKSITEASAETTT